MAITSANQKQTIATTSAMFAITSAKKDVNYTIAHFFVQLMINVVIPTTTNMAITSAKQGYNISLMVTTSPSIMKRQSNMPITSAKQINISCKHNGNMAITSANNIIMP